MKRLNCLTIIAMMSVVSACTPLAEGAQHSADTLTKARDDTASAWSKLFIYNPTVKNPQPASTRYCYQFQSDIVCYDSPQPQLTAKLVGAQTTAGAAIIQHSASSDVNMMSDVAPVMSVNQSFGSPMDTSSPVGMSSSSQIESRDLSPIKPFYPKESPYVKAVPIAK